MRLMLKKEYTLALSEEELTKLHLLLNYVRDTVKSESMLREFSERVLYILTTSD